MNMSTNNSGSGTPRLAPSPALLNDRHSDRHGDRHGDRQGERSSSSHHMDRQQQQQSHHSSQSQQQHHSSQPQNYSTTNGGNIHPALLAAVQQNRSNAGSPANLSRQMSNSGLSSPQLSAPYAAAALAAASPGGLGATGGLFGGQVGSLTGSLGLPSPTSTNQQGQPAQSKYGQLLSVIEDMGKDIRPTYACSKSSAERLKRGIIHARILVRECLMEIERSSRS